MNNQPSKTCTKCGETKPTTEFYKQLSAPDGLHSWCKTCHKSDAEQRRKGKRVTDRWANSIRSGYDRAGRLRLPREKFTSAELIKYWESKGISPDHSIYTGEPLGPIEESNHVLEHKYPMDEKEPSGPGHVLSNVVPATRSDNGIKGLKNIVIAVSDINKGRDIPEPPEELTNAVITSWETDEDK